MPNLFARDSHVFSIHLSVENVPVKFVTAAESLFTLYQNYFRYYHATKPTTSANNIVIACKLMPQLPAREKLLPANKRLLAEIGVVKFWEAERYGRQQYFLTTDSTFFRIDPARGRALGLIAKQALDFSHLLANTYTLTVLLLLLRWRTIYHLHTAAIISPQAKIYLVCGEQRAGKSTLTTALGLAGWRAISDDGILFTKNERDQIAWRPFKRDFHLATELLQKWSALQNVPSLYDYFDRSCINGLAVFDPENLADQEYTKIDYVLFPQIAAQPHSTFAALAPSEALQKLIGQSMFFPLWRTHTQQQLQFLTAAMQHAKFYTFFAGQDIWENPQLAATVLPH